jgi:type IV pilus assembly protein PilA
MLNKLRVRAQSESGFTLVELLVVMLIIGLLAAIAIPAFFNQRDKARDAEAKSAVKTAQTAMETYATDTTNGQYTGATVLLLQGIEPSLAGANGLALSDQANVAVVPGANSYAVSVLSDAGNRFSIERTGGTTRYDCATAGSAGCPTGGSWN